MEREAILPRMDGEGRFACDIACWSCGYNLRGVDGRGGVCPECGAGVEKSRKRYTQFWFGEGWLKGHLIGRLCASSVMMVMPISLGLEVFREIVLGRAYSFWGTQFALWLAGFAVAGVGVALRTAPIRGGGAKGGGGWLQAWVIAVGWTILTAGFVLWVLMQADMMRGDGDGSLMLWTVVGTFMGGSWIAQIGAVWGMLKQCAVLGREKPAWWLKLAYLPVPLFMAALVMGVVVVLDQLHLRDHFPLFVGVIIAAMLMGTMPMVVLGKLMQTSGALVDEAVHARLAARGDGSVPEGVGDGPVFWMWMQKRLAKRSERRLAKRIGKAGLVK